MDDTRSIRRSSPAHVAALLLAACRRTPALARAVRGSMDGRRVSHDWHVRFTRVPQWRRLADSIRAERDLPDDADRLAQADSLRAAALRENLGDADAVFWNALVGNDTAATRRCRRLRGSISARPPLEAPPFVPLADAIRRKWLRIARCEAVRSELRICDAAGKLLSAAGTDRFPRAVVSFFALIHAAPIAVWTPGESLARDRFEAELLPCFRFAVEPPGDPESRIYSTSPLRIPRRWRSVLRRAASVHASARVHDDAKDVDWKDVAARHIQSAIAEFAAGAGHEINNPLGAIKGQVLQLLPAESEPGRRESLRKILQQVDRIHRMIRDLHLVGREGRTEGAPLRLVEVLDAAVATVAGRGCVGELKLLPGSPRLFVRGDRAELVRLVVEVVQNAAQAAGEQGSVCVSVRTNAGGAEVVVTDTGPGFSEVDRRHAFTPFFSGRQAGRGLGMGLPVAARLLRDLDGSLEIHDVRPTTVVVRLPLVDELSEKAAA